MHEAAVLLFPATFPIVGFQASLGKVKHAGTLQWNDCLWEVCKQKLKGSSSSKTHLFSKLFDLPI